MEELLKALGWTEIKSPSLWMISFIKDNWRLNIYHTGTIQLQSKTGQQIIKKEIYSAEELEKVIAHI